MSSAHWVSAARLDNSEDRPLRLHMRLTDAGAGVSSAWVAVQAATGGPAIVPAQRLVSGTANDGVWEIDGPLPSNAATGLWHITDAYAVDFSGRRSTVSVPAGIPIFTVS